MEKATSKIAVISFVVLLVIASCAPLFSRVPAGAEAAKPVKRCNSNDDCKLFPCTSSFGLCVNQLCTCQVADISINDYPAPCRSSTDCRDTAEDCPWGKAVCHNGKCICIHMNPATSSDKSGSRLQNQND
ncbi:hypothetical protein PRUPE_1G297800 [Prunus persica]|uniref:Uncharacterized protein n=1 Tax=Prunus persica TaxID=3760 RepID=A0A251R578_PRUPE|nr:hypothetical protein PRUPE_1G297800 [Prunus persica]